MDAKVSLVIECLEKYKDHYVQDKDPVTTSKVDQLIAHLQKHDSLDGIKNEPDFRTSIIAGAAKITHSMNIATAANIAEDPLCEMIKVLNELVKTFPDDPQGITKNALRDLEKILAGCN